MTLINKETHMLPDSECKEHRRKIDDKAPGMEHIHQIKAEVENERRRWNVRPKDKIVGSFGIIEPNGYEHIISWIVNGYRNDKRHGAINPVPQDNYSNSLFESMFKGWTN